MFLRPQHFQAAQRHWGMTLATDEKWDHHYNCGVRSVELDLDALANWCCVVRSLKARLRDGTLVSVPEDGSLPAVDLRPAFAEQGAQAVTVSVGVPIFNLGRANVATNGQHDSGRYLLDSQDLE